MSAEFEIIKYTGKSSEFGTPVSSIGLKRIDAAVPAVYGSPIVPADDKSDVNTYSVYRPDEESDVAYSFESIFKLHLKVPPSNQLSNIRIWPDGDKPDDSDLAEVFIGMSQSYSRPTNNASVVAVNDLWSYTEDNPFLVSVGGETDQSIEENADVYNYNATVNDLGTGNLIYMNNERQIDIPIVEGNSYQIINKATSEITLEIYDSSDVSVSDPDIIYSTVGGEQVITINATATLLASYPGGFKYGSDADVSVGSTITWLDLGADPIATVEYQVKVDTLPNGDKVFFLNDVRNPTLNFRENKLYKFINTSGDTDPIRFVNKADSMIANVEEEIVIDGVTVTDGNTVDEVVLVDPKAVKMAGDIILAYQSTNSNCYGNTITNINTALIGNYNVNTVGGGTTNPLAAGETDYIYVQVKVTGKTTVGQGMPNIKIEYDEN